MDNNTQQHDAAGPDAFGDYFKQRGHLDLAIMLLKDSCEVILADPELKHPETRAELAWLRGANDGGICVDDVFATLNIPGWDQRFADLVDDNPAEVLERLKGLGRILTDISEKGPLTTLSAFEEDASVESAAARYMERARAC